MNTYTFHVLDSRTAPIPLTLDEATIIARGEIPTALATSLEQRGQTIPRKGTVQYEMQINLRVRSIVTRAFCRREVIRRSE